ncbi:MAG: 5-oxoprolinase subunit PxpB [Acidobacteria bacterium]|nr:MAG: 5-oxoprolinase subunit PxpB [Acidobacteriota bacterium]
MKPSSSRVSSPRYLVAGEKGLVVEFGSAIDPETNGRVQRLYRSLGRDQIPGVGEIVPTFRSLLVSYDPLVIGFDELVSRIQAVRTRPLEETPAKNVVIIPTVYGGEFGPDIEFVARQNHISVEEVIRLHTSVDYLVYMIGFTPGFPYLGGLPSAIATPRLQVPRTRVAAGSVGIAGEQTGVYAVESPGGWQLIGRTPLRLYDPTREKNPVLLEPGDSVRFERIDEGRFREMEDGLTADY